MTLSRPRSTADRFVPIGLATLFALTACGGGGGDAPPPPPPDPTVSAMYVNPVAGNVQDLVVTIVGEYLGQGLNVTSSPQCTSLTRSSAAPFVSAATTAYYRCTTAEAQGTTVTVAAARASDGVALDSASFTIGAPTTVTSALAGEVATPPDEFGQATPGDARFSQQMTVRIEGTNVNQGLSFDSPVCPAPTLSVSPPLVSTAAVAYYRCRATATNGGLNQLAVRLASDPPDSEPLFTPNFNVPLPQVTLTMATLDPGNQAKVAIGTVVLDLNLGGAAFVPANNFLDYVNSGFYNGTIFHLINKSASSSLVVGGRYAPTTGTPPPAPKPANPPSATPTAGDPRQYLQWTVAMSLGTALNPGLAQFFINMGANTGLNADSAVFATVVGGQGVLDTMFTACQQPLCEYMVPNYTIDSAVQTR
jgi:cyclophilin family peptidyl-prolyl cis-trans isomerase